MVKRVHLYVDYLEKPGRMFEGYAERIKKLVENSKHKPDFLGGNVLYSTCLNN